MADIAFILGLTMMLVGLVGVFVPVMPGVPVMLLGAFLYSWMTDWDDLTWPWLLLLTLLTVASLAFDFLASAWITRKLGGSRRAAAGAMLGTLAGILFFGAWGALLGGVGGAVAAEMTLRRPWKYALRSGSGAFLGFLVALVADLVTGVLMLGIFLFVTAS